MMMHDSVVFFSVNCYIFMIFQNLTFVTNHGLFVCYLLPVWRTFIFKLKILIE